MVVHGAAHHHPIDQGQLLPAGLQILQATVQFDGELRPVPLELLHQLVAQGRNGAVLLGIEPLQPGLARMHAEAAGAGIGQRVHEGQQLGVGVALVDADAVLHRHRQGAGLRHGGDAACHHLWLRHQAGAEAPLLHLLTGAAHVEVHFVVTAIRRDPRGLRQQPRVVTPQLQGHGMLDRVEADQPLQPLLSPMIAARAGQAAVVHRLGHHHLAVEQAAAADLTEQHPEVPIGVVQHRRHTEAVGSCRNAPGRLGRGGRVLGLDGDHPPMLPSAPPAPVLAAAGFLALPASSPLHCCGC